MRRFEGVGNGGVVVVVVVVVVGLWSGFGGFVRGGVGLLIHGDWDMRSYLWIVDGWSWLFVWVVERDGEWCGGFIGVFMFMCVSLLGWYMFGDRA